MNKLLIFICIVFLFSCQSKIESEDIYLSTQLDSVKAILIKQNYDLEILMSKLYQLSRQNKSMTKLYINDTFTNNSAKYYLYQSSIDTLNKSKDLIKTFENTYKKMISIVKDSLKINYLKEINLPEIPQFVISNKYDKINRTINEIYILNTLYILQRFMHSAINTSCNLNYQSEIIGKNEGSLGQEYNANVFYGTIIKSGKHDYYKIYKILLDGTEIKKEVKFIKQNDYTTLSFIPNQKGVYELNIKHFVSDYCGDSIEYNVQKKIIVK